MIMPSFTTLPESMLDSSGVQAKFATQALAGLRGMRGIYQGEGLSGMARLGCGCSELDDSGNCLDPDPCDTGGTSTTSDCAYGGTYPDCNPAPSTSTTSDCAYGGTYPYCNPAPSSTTSPTSTVPAFCASVGETYNPSTDLCNVATTGSGLSASQLQAIISGATKVGTVAAAGATGATVLANGTVIGSGGSSAAIASSFTSALTSLMPILLIGVVAMVVMKGAK